MPLLLRAIDEETITVGTLKSLDNTKTIVDNSPRKGLLRCSFEHRSGGKIYWNTNSDASAAGGAGDFSAVPGDRWEIWGWDDLRRWTAIKATGEADAVVAVIYEGS